MSLLPVVFAGSGDINIEGKVKESGADKIGSIGDLIGAAIGAAFLISFLLVFVMLMIGGIQWVTSGGDKEKTQAARDRITHALVGVAIIAGAWALMQLIGFFFGFNVLEGITLPSAAR